MLWVWPVSTLCYPPLPPCVPMARSSLHSSPCVSYPVTSLPSVPRTHWDSRVALCAPAGPWGGVGTPRGKHDCDRGILPTGPDRELQTVRQTMIDFLQNHTDSDRPPACPPLGPAWCVALLSKGHVTS